MKASDSIVQDPNAGDSWQRSDAALAVLLVLVLMMMAWTWVYCLPSALGGSEAAVEIILESFGMAAFMVSGLAWAYDQPRLLAAGGTLLGVGFYVTSLFLGDVVSGHNVGVAMRVGALSTVAFAAAGWRMAAIGNGELDKKGKRNAAHD